jgi:hypothetical protein
VTDVLGEPGYGMILVLKSGSTGYDHLLPTPEEIARLSKNSTEVDLVIKRVTVPKKKEPELFILALLTSFKSLVRRRGLEPLRDCSR